MNQHHRLIKPSYLIAIMLTMLVWSFSISIRSVSAQTPEATVASQYVEYGGQLYVLFPELKSQITGVYRGDRNACDIVMVLYPKLQEIPEYASYFLLPEQRSGAYRELWRQLQGSATLASEQTRDVYLLCSRYTAAPLSTHNYQKAITGLDAAESSLNGLFIDLAKLLGSTHAEIVAQAESQGRYFLNNVPSEVTTLRSYPEATIENITASNGTLTLHGTWPRD